MKTGKIILPVIVFLLCGYTGAAQQEEQKNLRPVEYEADFVNNGPEYLEKSFILTGNVIFHHNGAVITCDSAVIYNDRNLECFGRVLINQETTFIYGDRADYDGELNLANVYAPIIKMVDQDAVLHTYNFSFNTLDNIGTYSGGTMTQEENLLESERGYYYADTRDLVCLERVQLRDPDYMLVSDSVSYNMDTEIARFGTLTYIWNSKGEILSALSGRYDSREQKYYFDSDSYILTDIRESWADVMEYEAETEDVQMWNNIQIRDDEQKVIAFGDYGRYWGGREDALLTGDAQAMTIDPEQDTLYIRADTMWMNTFPYDHIFDTAALESLLPVDTEEELIRPVSADSPGEAGVGEELVSIPGAGEISVGTDENGRPVVTVEPDDGISDPEELQQEIDAGKLDTMYQTIETDPESPLSKKEVRQQRKRQKQLEKQIRREGREQQAEPAAEEDQAEDATSPVAAAEDISLADELDAEVENTFISDGVLETDFADTVDSVSRPVLYILTENGGYEPADQQTIASVAEAVAALELPVVEPEHDSLQAVVIDTLPPAPIPELFLLTDEGSYEVADAEMVAAIAAMPVSQTEPEHDSLQRFLRAYYNVRVYRSDFQAVCDSMTSFSKDSTLHMYIEPIMWNGDNQIFSDIVDIYTQNEELHKAVFHTGSPMMIGEVDDLHYNQIKGRVIEAYFRDNDVYRTDVVGNVETYYFETDDYGEPESFAIVEASDVSFYIEDQDLVKITYRWDVDWIMHPIDKIPLDQDLYLPGFIWHANRRPALEDVFNRIEKPSRRQEYEAMPLPEFPLTNAIMENKEDLIRRRVMTDRNDTLSPAAIEFLRILENERWEERYR